MKTKQLLLSLYYSHTAIWGVYSDDFADPLERKLWEALQAGEDIGVDLIDWAREIPFDRSKVEHYARAVIAESVARQKIDVLSAMQTGELGTNEGIKILQELSARLEKKYADFDDMYAAWDQPKHVVNLPWGIPWMDKHHPINTNGVYVFFGSQMIGKTWFALQLTLEWLKCGLAVSFVSLEMPRETLLKRFSILENNPVWSKDHVRLEGNFKVWDNLHICTPQTLEGILVQSKPDVVVVDNLSYLKADSRTYSEHQGIGDVVWDIKGLSRSSGIPFFCLAHNNRQAQARRRDPEPLITDLYGSSAIEKAASGVYGLFHPAAHDEFHPDPSEYKLFVLKDRETPMLSPKGDCCQLLRNGNAKMIGGRID